MITEKQEELLVKRLTDRINKANEYFLKTIGEYIKQIKGLSPSKAHQLVQILKYGGDYKKILKELEKYTDINIKDIETIFKEYAKKDAMFYEQFYQYRNKPFKSNLLDKEIDALKRVSAKALYDYTRPNVLGFTIRDTKNNVVKFLNLKETYNMILEQALLNVSQGKETFYQNMRKILEDIGSSGLRKVEYDGRSYRLDSIVRMHLKDSLRDLHNRNVELYGEGFDADGYEISVHGYPAEDHEDVQGRQFYIKDYEQLQETGVAKDVNKIERDMRTKYGFRQISAMNCYHFIFPIIVGINKPEYTDKQLEDIKKENRKGFDYEGQHYSMYEGTQLQRNIERNIREQKDIQILARASGDDELARSSQNKINILSKKYKELSDISTLPTQKNRLSVKGYRKIKVKEDNIKSISKVDISKLKENQVFVSKEESEKLNNMFLSYYEEEIAKKSFMRPLEKERYEKLLEEKKNGFKDEVITLDSIDNCNRLLDKINTEITGEEIKNTDFKLVQESTQILYEKTLKSPATLEELKFNRAWLQAEANTEGIANTRYSRITLNNSYFKDYNKLKETTIEYTELHDYLDGKKHSWWSPVAKGNETKEVITHEFGHRLQNDIYEEICYRKKGKGYDYFLKKYGVAQYSHYFQKEISSIPANKWDTVKRDLIYEPIRRLQEKEGLTQKEIIDKYVSMYGRKTYEEMFAETFANSQLGASNPLGDELLEFLIELGAWEK